ncbi:Tetratricopeptide repeat-containing protein [Geoalkalibacter ferrihydriticus]|uniref:Tetratricopeptide repeat protein n=2 Tax=Geoalkalibacter ferrihydriticus TaxID=392333 RepID=A0A0C2EFQ3_9BACT|nr:tetratricopeptide repeat protein [Geoalkalibacter ferrihydriticus]KIH77453.1 hypothetical protein GFER_01615 [Geoalkalibacter ferrihydriticus DSM 17813]SDM14441.1 Tetratricopeptide repeat-containing protein [Geoalkalibacter ferrihydriticus]
MVFSRLFGRKNPLVQMRRALQDNRWADVLQIGEGIDREALPEADRHEFETLLGRAGDHLAQLNLEEGEGCLRAGENLKAREHLELALTQVRNAPLRQKIATALSTFSTAGEAPVATASATAAHCASGGCAGSGAVSAAAADPQVLDESSRFELILASYPPELAQRYLAVSEPFRQAFLATHEGRDREALDLYSQIPEAEQDDLFFFERGCLAARSGDAAAARRDLGRALELNPAHVQALEALVTLELSDNQLEQARTHALRALESGTAPAFCLSRLAIICTRQGDLDQALAFARQALQGGGRPDPEIVLLTSSLLEKRGELAEAEQLLSTLGGGGCKGGASAYLAEFWLRHGRHLDKALDAFNQAARQEPANPRWQLRIGETYLARGWKKDGLALVEKIINHPDLPSELRAAAEKLVSTPEKS